MLQIKKILFLSGTRADFGKLKALMEEVQASQKFQLHVFCTGMHMLSKYGYTCEEVDRCGFANIYKFINQNLSDGMDQVLAKTISGLSDYIHEVQPDMLVVHGDRVEALAGAIVGSLNNILTAHVEGGEVSGTVDELIRHTVTKMSHVHFVSNQAAQKRIIQLGENEKMIHVVGSPDIDVMNSDSLPSIDVVCKHYEINFVDYAILSFHPVTTELSSLREQVHSLVKALELSERNYVVIYPNNDAGAEIIFEEYERIKSNPRFRLFPSMRFEYFLSLLKHAEFMIGNSSAGVREAPHFGVPSVNVGTRQHNRICSSLVVNVSTSIHAILNGIGQAITLPRKPERHFGDGSSAIKFIKILKSNSLWNTPTQKFFIDRDIS